MTFASGIGPRAARVLRRRASAVLWLLIGLGALATVADALTAKTESPPIVAVGLLRLAALGLLVAVIHRAADIRHALGAAVFAIAMILCGGPSMGAARGEFATSSIVSGSLCVAVAAFLPWGWRIQLFVVAIALAGVGVPLALGFAELEQLAPQSMVLTLVCTAISFYFALDHERTWSSLDEHVRAVERSRTAIAALTAELEERVAARVASLESAKNQLASFCTSLASDLRPTLTLLLSNVSRVRDALSAGDEVDRPRLLARVAEAAERMQNTLDELLGYVALANVPLRLRDVDLGAAAERAVGRRRERDPGRRVEVTIAAGLTVRGDPDLLAEAIDHLIDNAWKFTAARERATIAVGADGEGNDRIFFVRDNGVGFDMAHAASLFQPFARLEAMGAYPGLGMGLARARRILERHGGSVWADAAPGQGATIRFRLGRRARR